MSFPHNYHKGIQFLTVDANGIFALFTFVIQKQFISLSIKDLTNTLLPIASLCILQYLRTYLKRNLDCFIAKHSGPEQTCSKHVSLN